MIEPFLAKKALDFTLPTLGKCLSVVVKGLIVLGVIALIAWSIYVTVVRPHTKPNPTTKQEAEEIINYQTPKVMFGCMRWELPKERK